MEAQMLSQERTGLLLIPWAYVLALLFFWTNPPDTRSELNQETSHLQLFIEPVRFHFLNVGLESAGLVLLISPIGLP